MKKRILFISLCIAVLCAISVQVRANYAAGGELFYEWITGNTYTVYFKLHRSCAGNAAPTTIPLCFTNSCNSSTFTLTMSKISAPLPPAPKAGCATLLTKCESPSATVPGYQEVWYSAEAVIPFQCNSWRMFVSLATRSASLNIANATATNMYIEAYFNNSGSLEGNSSPVFGPKPVASACQDHLVFDNSASDPNGDSLVYEVIQPLTSTASCATPSAASLVSTTPALSIPANPFQTYNTFAFNPMQGLMAFYSAPVGTHTMAIRAKEYRNGVLVGSVMREMPVNVYNCPPAPILVPLKGGLPNPGSVFACKGEMLNFGVEATSNGTLLFVSDNHNLSLPASTAIYQNQLTDSVTGNISWLVPANASGQYTLTVTVKDSSCNLPLGPFSYVSIVNIQIVNQVKANPDTTVCPGTPVDLKLLLPMYRTWSVLSGDMNSLSCLNCNDPIAAPTTSSAYEVTVYSLPPGCPSKDTVYLDVIPYNRPSASIAANPNTNIWPGLNVLFTATTTNCTSPQYQWRINGHSVPGATASTFNTTTLKNNDIVTCLLTCSDTCLIDTPSNAITINVATGISDIHAHSNRLYPNPNNGSFTLSTAPGNIVDLDIINTLGQAVWSQRNVRADASGNIGVQTGSLPDGHYMLKVLANGRLEMIKLSIQQ